MQVHDSARDFLAVLLCSILAISITSPVTISFVGGEEASYDSSDEEDDSEEQDQDPDQGDDDQYSEIGDEPDTPQATATFAYDDVVTISEEEIVTVNVLANDGSMLDQISPTISEVSNPLFGTVMVNYDNTITYSPFQAPLPSGYERHDSFQYTVTLYDESHYSGTVNVWISQTNDPPVAYSAEYTTVKNKPLKFVLPAYDEDNDVLTFVIVTNTTFGELELDQRTGQVKYTPREDHDGKDTLTFLASDGTTNSSIATINILIFDLGGPGRRDTGNHGDENDDDRGDHVEPSQNSTDDNSKPIANAGASFNAIAGNEISLNGSGSYDPDGDELIFSWSQVGGPDASIDNSTLASPTIIAPEVDSETVMTFELVVSDGLLSSNASKVIITVVPVKIDVIPGVNPNKIYLGKPDKEIPVAIIGNASLDVYTVDQETLIFGPSFAQPLSFELVDFNSDGYKDLISYYRTGDIGLHKEDKTACLSGYIALNSDDLFDFSTCSRVRVLE